MLTLVRGVARRAPDGRRLPRTSISRVRRYDALCRAHAQCRRRLRDWAWERLPHVCWMCLTPLERETMTLDHVLPLSRGGRSCIRNVALSCRSCNAWRGAWTIAELWASAVVVSASPATWNGV